MALTLERRAHGTDRAGAVRMVDVCEVAGLGEFQGRYRDGSAVYYVSEPRVTDDPSGSGR